MDTRSDYAARDFINAFKVPEAQEANVRDYLVRLVSQTAQDARHAHDLTLLQECKHWPAYETPPRHNQLMVWANHSGGGDTFYFFVPNVTAALVILDVLNGYERGAMREAECGLCVVDRMSSTFDAWCDFEGRSIHEVRRLVSLGEYDVSLLYQPSGNDLDRHITGE